MWPYYFKDTPRDHNAVKAIERGLKIYIWSQGPHSQKHFKDEQTKKNVLCPICEKRIIIIIFLYRVYLLTC